jgi:flagellar hook protein FlgE
MSLLTAIDSALAGLNAQATALSNISNNVSNSSTVGYKEADTEFESMVLASNSGSSGSAADLAGSSAITRMDISQAGQIQTTGVATDVAVNGAGFLVVNNEVNSSTGSYYVTRAGSFRPDANGNLVNSGGYYLQGVPLDANGNPVTAGNPNTFSALSTVNIANLTSQSTPTTEMAFTANLPSANTAYAATAPAPSTSTVNYYDPLGATQTLQFSFTPTVPATAGSPPSNTWTMNVYDSATSATAPVGTATMTFQSTGANAGELQSVTATTGTYDPNAGTLTITTGSGETLPITIGSPDAPGGMTQLDGGFNTSTINQNGSGFGLLQGVTIGGTGKVVASFTNGATRPIYQLDLATFPDPDGLTPASGGAFALSPQAGVPQLFEAGTGPVGTTEGGALEGSNVDLGTQLTNLIETQRAYSSTAEVIKSATDMLDVVNHLNG